MDYVILGFVVLVLIFGIVAAIIGRTTWRVYHIVLAVFLLLTGLTYFYIAARTLKAQRNWQTVVEDFKKQIRDIREDTKRINEGDGETLSIDKLKEKVNGVLADRGRVWQNVKPTRVEITKGGTASVQLVKADPQLVASTRLFVFADAPLEKGGEYLGEFVIAKATGKAIDLAPAMNFDQRTLNRLLAANKGTWSLYEIMPNDSHEALKEVDDKTRTALLPPEVIDEYKRDGEEAKANDPESRVWIQVKFTKPYDQAIGKENLHFKIDQLATFDAQTADELVKQKRVAEVVKRVYVRPLRDYAHLLREANRQQEESQAALEEVGRQIKDVENARAKLDQDIAASKQLIADLKSDRENFTRERDALVKYVQEIDEELTVTRAKLRTTLDEIRSNSNALAKLQLEALDHIDRIAPAPGTVPQARAKELLLK